MNGKKHGYGKYVYEDGVYVQGLWRNDELNGAGKLYFSNGKLVYDGEYENGQFHGFGRVYNWDPKPTKGQGINYKDFGTVREEWKSYEGNILLIEVSFRDS